MLQNVHLGIMTIEGQHMNDVIVITNNDYIAVFRQPRIQTRQYLDKYCFNQSESRHEV